MTVIGSIGFTNSWLLLGLFALPILWFLLRAMPPAPKRIRFPGVRLLLGLTDDSSQVDRTPWWLLLIRIGALAAIILGLAGPVLNPKSEALGKGPVLLLMDASWGSATSWAETMHQVGAQLDEASRAGRPVSVLQLTAPKTLNFRSARSWKQQISGLQPQPWQATPAQVDVITGILRNTTEAFDTLWFSDGLEAPWRSELLEALEAKGTVEIYENPAPVIGLTPISQVDSALEVTVVRNRVETSQDVQVLARGTDPGGTIRTLAQTTLSLAVGQNSASTQIALPSEMKSRITRFELAKTRSAGAVTLTDGSLQRREVALLAARSDDEGLALLSPLHYLRQALNPTADLLEGALPEVLPANPDVIVLADVANLSPDTENDLIDWVRNGGLLLRFAGPRLAASNTARAEEEALMPVRLRIGGRSIGGAMSWGEPKTLAPFPTKSPFFGLDIPNEVTVSSQVMAQPSPDLPEKVIAELADGTPLVTRKFLGQGQVVLFHVTANADWSSLPLSGLFVQMLERLAVSSSTKQPSEQSLEGTVWQPILILDGFGRNQDAGAFSGVVGPELATSSAGPNLPPGLYQHEKRTLAKNVLSKEDTLVATSWPPNLVIHGYDQQSERRLGGLLIALAILLLATDTFGTLAVAGRLSLPTAHRKSTLSAVFAFGLALSSLLLAAPDTAVAQQGHQEYQPEHTLLAGDLVLAHVLTGHRETDRIAQAGLRGLSDTLFFRTSVEPTNPIGIDLEKDELSFFPLIYWPVTPNQPLPSAAAYDRLNNFLRSGGMILFDTRDAGLAAPGAVTPSAQRLQQLAVPLDIPPLEPVPSDHVLTRAFYLLQEFPGRYTRGTIWVEAATEGAEEVEGLPFRDLNDGVTPVVVGGNDWAAAWAVDDNGRPLLPIGRGYAGERQRELAHRFGVNLVMHVLTGNYKSDQVHVPELLQRLGQ